ncbi:ABC transporter permease [Prosthecobacter sp.]|uniref:ABC transporter permease n=1 Tax=Prosthecobacter sp. TaxID=1965333 RepID=UPI002AB8EB36|nr:ABC transporter permease [Prosthecobacter sp.]MDZ4402375.1 ABC transporter permease [Prosthecobacter sp.]
MRDYFIRRFLLIIPTLIGATMVVFFITRVTPGGPLEAALRQAAAQQGDRGMKDAGASLSEEQKEEMAAYYGFDRSFFPAYLAWLGILPKEGDKQFIKFAKDKQEMPVTLQELLPRDQWKPNNAYRTTQAKVTRDGKLSADDASGLKEWQTRAEKEKERVQVFRPKFDGLLQGNLGISTRYNEYVWDMIRERMPISIFYGLVTFIISYLVCIPLGILKAIKHRTVIDNASSILIFVGYSIPGFVLASVLVVYLAARLNWFPTGGFVSENFASLTVGGKAWDVMHHAVLPLICYMVGSFAFMTMLVKNNLMDNLAADYVRTAVAKGAGFKRAVLVHALRNSLIPLATTLGHIVSIFVAGSTLIELIFEINGFGLLGYYSLLDRDYPLVMGILVVDVVLLMLGNILSDYFVALTDPRVRFD